MHDPIQRLDAHFRAMPPVAALAISVDGVREGRLHLSAPLSVHVNDKACAFGGSLVSLMTLAGWGLVTTRLEALGLDADVFVADSHVRYLAPLYDDLRAAAGPADEAEWPGFVDTLRARGRARLAVVAEVRTADGTVATAMDARFAAKLR